MRRIVVALVLLAAVALTPLLAQEEAPGPITWVGFSQLKAGKSSQDAVRLMLKDQEFMDGLVANGTIISYGAVTPINHHPDDNWNYAEFVTLQNWQKIGEWVGAFMGYVNGLGEEEQQARQQEGMEVHEAGSHFDWVVRHVRFKAAPTPPAFFYMANFTVKPGQEDGPAAVFDEIVVPALEPLQSGGEMGSIGLYVPEVHGDHGWSHVLWYSLSGLASVDKMQAAFAEAAGPGMQAWGESMFERGTHYDKILLVVHYKGPESGSD